MNQDPLEKYINRNRSEFDSETPSEKVWESISGHLRRNNRNKGFNFSLFWKAAAILFFGISTYLLIERNQQADNVVSSNIYEEFSTTEAYYNSIIQVRKDELFDYLDEGSPFYNDFVEDIHELDSIYDQLKAEYVEANEDVVMEALVRNLQLRIEVMDRQLQIIQRVQKLNENKSDDEFSI